MNKEWINVRFDEQVDKGQYLSKLDKILFNLTFEFTLHDYKHIQTKKYFEELDVISSEWEKRKYKIQAVKNYINFKT